MTTVNDVYNNGASSLTSYPYEASLSSSSTASSPSSSVFSIATSQTSRSSTSTIHSDASTSDSDIWSSRAPLAQVAAAEPALAPIARVSTFPQCRLSNRDAARHLPPLRIDSGLPVDKRHPRRSSTLQGPPPQLVRQAERKGTFVDGLVDSATQMVEAIWPLSVRPSSRCESASRSRGVLPLRTYIQETLRRSRTSYYTLQVALYYLIMIKSHVPKHDFTMEQAHDTASHRALQCGRRMFLAALILASKYLQDRNYSAQAWSKMSGLSVCEINTNEMAFLEAVKWKLHITGQVWDRWQEVIFRYTPSQCPPFSPGACTPNTWKVVLPHLSPELENIVVPPKTPISPVRPVLRPSNSQYSLRYPLPLPEGSNSQESTPTPGRFYMTPHILEPNAEPIPPTPPHVRLSKLPTPALTPMSIASNTPSLSGLGPASRRPSMCLAMAQAQSSSLARSCVDQYNPSVRNGLEAYHFSSRRPSLAPSTTSSASSPESMVTDNSRSSRASSISSVSSACFAPHRAPLARLATCRNVRLPMHTLSKCTERSESPSSHASSPDLESFHISDSDGTPMRVDSPQSVIAPRDSKRRKRGISSVSTELQQNVQDLLSKQSRSCEPAVLPDRSVASSFLLSSPDRMSLCAEPKGQLSRKLSVAERPSPVQKEPRKKQKCCATEALQHAHFEISRREGIS